MKYYLYEYSANWADEMDVAGFMLLTGLEKDMALASIKKKFRKGGTVYIGTNEEIEYSDYDEVMSDVSITEISKQDYDTINRLFGTSFGETGPCEDFNDSDDFDEDYEGDDDDDDDDDDDEEDYETNAEKVVSFIKKEFNLEENDTRHDVYSSFSWKPTPKTQIEITIPDEDDGEEEVEVTLKLNGRELNIEFFDVDITANSTFRLEHFIKDCVQRANKF
jgi:hypothetical protein